MLTEFREQINCINCSVPHLVEVNEELYCSACQFSYPKINSIPVLTPEPLKTVAFWEDILIATYAKEVETLALVLNSTILGTIRKARLQNHCISKILNLRFIADLLWPGDPTKVTRKFIDSRPHGECLDVQNCVSFFLRDWSGAREFQETADFVLSHIERYLSCQRNLIAVFGSGAGGLAWRLSKLFRLTLAIDLNLPSTICASHITSGGDLTVHWPTQSEVKAIRLSRGGEQVSSPVYLIADAEQTPIVSEKVDCVLTSFLLDLVGQPYNLLREISRILKQGGIWINYGPLGNLGGAHCFHSDELFQMCQPLGFSMQRATDHRVNFLDFTHIDRQSLVQSHVCALTVFQKTPI